MEGSRTAGGEAPGRAKKRISPWLWVGCGCGALVLLAALAAGGFVYVGMRQVREMETLRHDPAALARRIQAIVPYRDLPAGYEPDLVISVPILTETAIFARRRPGQAAPASDAAPRFIYSRTLALGGGISTEAQRKRFLDPRQGMPPWLGGLSIHVPHVETLRTGELDAGGHRVYYRVQRALLDDHGEKRSIFTTVAMIDCRDGMHAHSVVWTDGRFGAGPAEEGGQGGQDGAADPGGAAQRGDPAAVAEFLSHFRLCGPTG
jgi:hypothetical protein